MAAPSSRIYNCARCHQQVVICLACDRGHRYCAGPCSKEARRRSVREARGRYERSAQGRERNRVRQKRWRNGLSDRRRSTVTHQGSPAPPPLAQGSSARVAAASATRNTAYQEAPLTGGRGGEAIRMRCHFCGVKVQPFFRLRSQAQRAAGQIKERPGWATRWRRR